jgi:hypothetical protein
MGKTRSKAIIAVFGSNLDDTPKFAKAVGAAIASRGHISLTGGTGKGDNTVKDQTIRGALGACC